MLKIFKGARFKVKLSLKIAAGLDFEVNFLEQSVTLLQKLLKELGQTCLT